MRSLAPTLALVSATLCAVSPLGAQRARQALRRHHAARTADAYAPTAYTIPTRCSDTTCDDGDVDLAIVAALFPYNDGRIVGPGVITLVVENRGTTRAPLAVVDVTPLTRFASARHTSVGALGPGERTVIEIPVEMGPHGAPCVSISVTPVVPPAVAPVVFASAAAQ